MTIKLLVWKTTLDNLKGLYNRLNKGKYAIIRHKVKTLQGATNTKQGIYSRLSDKVKSENTIQS